MGGQVSDLRKRNVPFKASADYGINVESESDIFDPELESEVEKDEESVDEGRSVEEEDVESEDESNSSSVGDRVGKGVASEDEEEEYSSNSGSTEV